MADAETRARIDRALSEWRQGDCVLGEHWFLFRMRPDAPLTREAAEAAREGVDAGEAEVLGFMVATQTCDIVRSCAERPFVEVCPLVEVDEDVLRQIQQGWRPRYAYVPGVAGQRLVADLDRVMSVEKAVLTDWKRTEGCRNDAERRRLAFALARKRVRFAFPDDFVRLVGKLQAWMRRKHDRNSEAGRALRALREVRVRAAPSWDADEVKLFFWFIRDTDTQVFGGARWDEYLEKWLSLVRAQGRFVCVDGQVATLDDLTARDYVESDPLDLDHLTSR